MNRRYWHSVLLTGIILIGFALRLYQLDTVAFRGDEAFSVQRWAVTPLAQSLTEIASLEPHPPLTYVIFRGWGLLFPPTGEFALRMLPVLFNMIGLAGMYAFARRLSKNASVALIAALMWAVHPFEIWHAQDFRNYGIWAGLSVIVLWLAIRVINTQGQSWRDWLIYLSAALFSCLVFYNELITIGVLGLYVMVTHWKHPRFAVQWSLANGAIILLTIATFVVFQGDLLTGGGYAGTTGGFQIEQWWQRFIPVLYAGDTLSLTLQQQFNPATNWWSVFLVYTVILTGYFIYRRPQGWLLIVMLAFIPLIILGVISLPLRIFRPRYVLMAVPGYILLVSYVTVLLWRPAIIRKVLSVMIIGSWLIVSGISLNNYYHNDAYDKAPRWRELIMFLENHVEAEAIVIQTGVDPAFGLYFEYSDIDAGEFGLPVNFDQPVDEIIRIMEDTTEDYQDIWILGQTFPDWQNAGVVEDWASDNLQLIQETNQVGVPVRHFVVWDVSPDEVIDDPLAIFDDAIALRGIDLQQSDFTDTLIAIVYWESLATTDTPLTVFSQLIGDLNPTNGTPVWSQDDHPPQNGRISTDIWQIGEIYRDVYRLSLTDVSVGEYALWIGFYDPQTGERLRLEDGSDAFVIEGVIVE